MHCSADPHLGIDKLIPYHPAPPHSSMFVPLAVLMPSSGCRRVSTSKCFLSEHLLARPMQRPGMLCMGRACCFSFSFLCCSFFNARLIRLQLKLFSSFS